MFFQKNIFEDLELGKKLKVNKTICYIIFSFFISKFIFYLSFFITIFIDHAQWRFVCHIITSFWASYSIFSRSHTRIRCSAKRREKEKKKKTKRTKWRSTQRCVFQICYRASICWLHHRFTSINVVNSENQNIDENRSETNEVKINSFLRSSNLWAFNMLTTSQSYFDKCNNLISHSVNSNSNDLWKCF